MIPYMCNESGEIKTELATIDQHMKNLLEAVQRGAL